ncbi:Glycosyl transferase family 2 [Candidatus Omnitrophus magneticus]|uniref:Glycosyl transferase family 2 n=1 Tax=Candidatus Omnitrophus magneticus TaxID=1609969 RepID=A0A0F0CR24_9BACT|nr:Glycosyl transferase family 2 [Candidatus Omnitrophus magneticus]
MKISIIIPTYNEEKTIKKIIDYVQGVAYPADYEIIIVDDASIDRTIEKEFLIKLKNKKEKRNIRIFKNRINRGKGFSIRKGIKRSTGDIIVIQDADREYDPQDIPKLVMPIINGECLVVYGSRFLGAKWPQGMAFQNLIANKLLTWITNILYGTKLTDEATCYKIFKTDVVKSMDLRANRFTFCPEVTAKVAKKGITIKELPISYNGRTSNQGKKIKAKDFLYAVLTLLWQRIIK